MNECLLACLINKRNGTGKAFFFLCKIRLNSRRKSEREEERHGIYNTTSKDANSPTHIFPHDKALMLTETSFTSVLSLFMKSHITRCPEDNPCQEKREV